MEDGFTPRQGLPSPDAHRRPFVTWALLAANGAVWLATTVAGGSEDPDVMLEFGALFGPYVAAGEYWRLFTAMFLHFGVAHLFFNSLALLIFAQIVERSYGHVRFVVIYLLTGLVGSIASFVFNPLAIAAGASGAIFGVLGALAAYFVAQRDMLGSFGRRNLIGILILMGVQLFYGFGTEGVDNWAHMGGLAAGFPIGLALAPRYRILRSPFGTPVGIADTNPMTGRWWVLPVAASFILVGYAVGSSRVPDNAFTRLVIAERHYEDKDLRRALEEIDRAIEVEPAFGRSYYLRGRVLLELGDEAAARTELAVAARIGDRQTRREAIALLVSIDSRRQR